VCFLGAKIQIKASSFYDEVTAFLFLEKKTYVSIDLFCSGFLVKTCASVVFAETGKKDNCHFPAF